MRSAANWTLISIHPFSLDNGSPDFQKWPSRIKTAFSRLPCSQAWPYNCLVPGIQKCFVWLLRCPSYPAPPPWLERPCWLEWSSHMKLRWKPNEEEGGTVAGRVGSRMLLSFLNHIFSTCSFKKPFNLPKKYNEPPCALNSALAVQQFPSCGQPGFLSTCPSTSPPLNSFEANSRHLFHLWLFQYVYLKDKDF